MKEPKLSMPTTYTDEMTKNELRKELATIKSEFNTAETDYTKAAEKQYLQYARWYLHWRKLSDSHSDFLKEEYDANNLSSLRKSDNVEFRRFVSYSLGTTVKCGAEKGKKTCSCCQADSTSQSAKSQVICRSFQITHRSSICCGNR